MLTLSSLLHFVPLELSSLMMVELVKVTTFSRCSPDQRIRAKYFDRKMTWSHG